MRLINTSNLELHDFSASIIPKYAILSHTWGEDEVTFQDMSSPDRTRKRGWNKIAQTCRIASTQRIDYAWVDTSCIDKSSSAELTESINSMFQWYQNAAVCYTILEDLSPHDSVDDQLMKCRWFTRGWTLQELLAPKKLEFFDAAWKWRGSKLHFGELIAGTLNIPLKVFSGDAELASCNIGCKMSWAAGRQTTRVEDMAYCLMGLFDVNMPLLYGEGKKAFRRLQKEIVKRSSDLSIFAWDAEPTHEKEMLGLFAESPSAFRCIGYPWSLVGRAVDFAITNKGIRFPGDNPRVQKIYGPDGTPEYCLWVVPKYRAIYLRKISPGFFYRPRLPLIQEDQYVGDLWQPLLEREPSDYYIVLDPAFSTVSEFRDNRSAALHVTCH
jgi:hypothetical protein